MAKPGQSLRAAIDAKCRDCIFDEHAPGRWRQQVSACACTKCALWPHRTHRRQRDPKVLTVPAETGLTVAL